MKKIFNVFFVVLGVIFFILILIGSYLFIADPYNLKPIFFGQSTIETGDSSVVTDKHPILNDSQEKTLETLGIDPANLPTEITPAQGSCFESMLGSARVEEIKAGSSPTTAEVIKARDCL